MLSLPKVYHYSNEGVITWYDFAKAVMEYANIDCEVIPIATKDYPTLAKRPYYSALDLTKIKDELALAAAPWGESLEKMVYFCNNNQ